jgi:hypothetical protein
VAKGWKVLFLYDPDGNLLELTEVGVGHDVLHAAVTARN